MTLSVFSTLLNIKKANRTVATSPTSPSDSKVTFSDQRIRWPETSSWEMGTNRPLRKSTSVDSAPRDPVARSTASPTARAGTVDSTV